MTNIYVACPAGEIPSFYGEITANSAEEAAALWSEKQYSGDPYAESVSFGVDVYRENDSDSGFHLCGEFTVHADFSPMFTAYER